MSFSFTRNQYGAIYSMANEGSSGNPVDFEYFFQGVKDFVSGLQQYPKNYGSGTESDPHELCENNASEWSESGDIGTPVDEGVDVSKGSYSIKATKSGSGTCVLMWNENGTFENQFDSNYHYFNPEAGDRIRFEIKPSNAAIKLESVKVWTDSNRTGHEIPYWITHTNDDNGWTLSADTWNEFEWFLRDFDSPNYRFYCKYINRIDFTFSGGVTSDTILIDGLRIEHPDAGIKKYGGNTYVSTYGINITTCYFKQRHAMNLDIVAGACYYGYGLFDIRTCPQFQMGGLGGDVGEYLFPININIDTIETDTYNVRMLSNSADITFDNVNIRVPYWPERHGVYNGTPGNLYGTGAYKMIFRNCNIVSGDLSVMGKIEFRNCVIQGYRHPIWGPDAVLENVKLINMQSSHCWVDWGELRGASFVDWTPTGVHTCVYMRQYRSIIPRTVTIINATHNSNPNYMRLVQAKYWITEEQRVVDQICKFGFTMNVKVKNAAGTLLEEAAVLLLDKDDNVIFDVLTDVNGDIVEQDVIVMEQNLNNPLPDDGSHTEILYPWRTGDTDFETEYYPFKLTISKDGYADYQDDTFELWVPYNQEIVLQEEVLQLPETMIYGAELYDTIIY